MTFLTDRELAARTADKYIVRPTQQGVFPSSLPSDPFERACAEVRAFGLERAAYTVTLRTLGDWKLNRHQRLLLGAIIAYMRPTGEAVCTERELASLVRIPLASVDLALWSLIQGQYVRRYRAPRGVGRSALMRLTWNQRMLVPPKFATFVPSERTEEGVA